jgi:hypothetical protein
MKNLFLSLILLITAASGGAANLYQVDIDTSSVAGQEGNISLQLGILGNPDPLTVTISNFTVVGGTLGGVVEKCFGFLPCPIDGELPADATLSFENTESFVEYFQSITWGTALRFHVSFFGLAITNPTPGADPSTFEILLLDDSGVTALLSTDPFGRLSSWRIDDQGISLENLSENGVADISQVPEPSTIGLLLLGAALLGLRSRAVRARR